RVDQAIPLGGAHRSVHAVRALLRSETQIAEVAHCQKRLITSPPPALMTKLATVPTVNAIANGCAGAIAIPVSAATPLIVLATVLATGGTMTTPRASLGTGIVLFPAMRVNEPGGSPA